MAILLTMADIIITLHCFSCGGPAQVGKNYDVSVLKTSFGGAYSPVQLCQKHVVSAYCESHW